MKVLVIHGQLHQGSTYHTSKQLIQKLQVAESDVKEFFLPTQGPSFCVGCFQCIAKDENKCPQANKTQPLVQAMLEADVIVVDSPTYCLEMSGQLKTFFDHLGYLWLSHRPQAAMFQKVGVAISTAAGGGAKNVTKSIARQLFWMGVPKTYRLALLSSAMSYQEISLKRKAKMDALTTKVAHQIQKELQKPQRTIPFTLRFLFFIMHKMQQKNTWNEVDHLHWKTKGWLGKLRPWQHH